MNNRQIGLRVLATIRFFTTGFHIWHLVFNTKPLPENLVRKALKKQKKEKELFMSFYLLMLRKMWCFMIENWYISLCFCTFLWTNIYLHWIKYHFNLFQVLTASVNLVINNIGINCSNKDNFISYQICSLFFMLIQRWCDSQN